jgi:putative DNA primase/helicase
MQTPPDYAAAAAILALAGCVNRRVLIRPKQEDDSWMVVPNLWGAIIAAPGLMKSSVLRSMTLPLTKIEQLWRVEHEERAREYTSEKEQAELKWQAWREDYKRAVKKGISAPAQPDKTIQPPTQKRLVLTDSTFEKLHEILSENPAGVLVVRDELTGWLAELDRQGREGERAFYLQAWNGDAGFSVDRIGRGSIHVPAVCVSLLGNIQPARLRSYLSDAVAGGPSDDGLFQRFQVLVWPDLPRGWKLIDRPPNGYALAMAEKVFSLLANLSADTPAQMHFDPDAQQLFFEWWSELERKVRGECGLQPAIVAHLSKYRSLMPSLAGLFELTDRAALGGELEEKITVSLEQTQRAAAFCDYFESHAHRVYTCVVSPECRAARELARHIQSGDLANIFKTRDAYLKGWSGLDTPERVRGALALLEDSGWVLQAESKSSASGGRPSELWLVNPKVVRREE